MSESNLDPTNDLRSTSSADYHASRGPIARFVGDYRDKTRQFSRNANLYVIHVIGMDMIHGSFNVLLNLYLLAVGYDIAFIGTRLMVGFIARAATALPAGLISDRIGRKASFILGDGVGAVIGLIVINSSSEFMLLLTPVFASFFGNLHHTAEPAFMAENSKPSERVHLFAVAGSFRTMSAMAGALIAGTVPALFADDIGIVQAYRYAVYGGLALWALSLIPALMLRSHESEERPEEQFSSTPGAGRFSLTGLFSGITHPRRIFYFVLTSAIIAAGFSMIAPMFNVVFHSDQGHIRASEGQVGIVFASAEMTLAVATIFVPLLAARMLKVDAIVLTRILSIPFVLAMGLLPFLFGEGMLLLVLSGAAYVGRVGIFRLTSPLDDAFNMGVLDAKERATNTGLEMAVGGAVSAVAIWFGSRMLNGGDFTTPFFIMGSAIALSSLIYWRVFRPLELSELGAPEPPEPTRALAD
ncbi:MAG: MFS transporter [Chloroflexi bacterium]|nr:MFS transporter [Chloroflexota bacterium]MCI0776287.1 MFS transporter [Chloroflexota bacterium]MCI0808274.1 MFS transporter [Chloroflexota bacterium]MCI0835328.1 MFS transporter [Chloroflexota bacterium]MCI0837562.1 MFS transporter [Chloroflexota bacterium]